MCVTHVTQVWISMGFRYTTPPGRWCPYRSMQPSTQKTGCLLSWCLGRKLSIKCTLWKLYVYWYLISHFNAKFYLMSHCSIYRKGSFSLRIFSPTKMPQRISKAPPWSCCFLHTEIGWSTPVTNHLQTSIIKRSTYIPVMFDCSRG